MKTVKVAVAQYDIGFFHCWSDYVEKITRWVSDAASEEARLLVMPEYGTLELSSLLGEAVYSDLQKTLQCMQHTLEDWHALQRELALQFDVILVAASYPVLHANAVYTNRAFVYSPDGLLGFQDKLIMTRFENEQWFISPGKDIKVIDSDIGRLGINICYDSEFPLIARRQIEAGARVLVVPSCTDTAAGFYRVRIACQARALENQCYVIHSTTSGKAPWSEAVDINTGCASIYSPVDYGFPDDGIVAQGQSDQPGWIYAKLDLDLADRVRLHGQVTNYNDWGHQSELLARSLLRND
ncbi:MAG: carbon-nitrogen hydrolase family protein [Granulosicoccus sp.]